MPFEPKQLDNTEEEAAKRVIIERSSKNNKYNKQLKMTYRIYRNFPVRHFLFVIISTI